MARRRRFIAGLVAAAIALSVQAHGAPRMARGVNMGNALDAPSEGAWGVTLEEEYFDLVASAGFDHIRLPVRWSAHAMDEAPFTIDEAFMARVEWAVDAALDRGLCVVLNVHHYEEMDKDPDGHEERLVALWQQISAKFADRPAALAFELFNEPHGEFTPEKWNAVMPRLVDAVRETNPTRAIVIGSAGWNNWTQFKNLTLPEDRSNLVATFHYYDPFEFTHQGAEWVGANSEEWLGREWTGTEEEKAKVREALDAAAAFGRENGVPVYLGEFGAYSKAPDASRAAWTAFIAREAEARGMPWSYWEFCAGFGVYDREARAWRPALKAALLPE